MHAGHSGKRSTSSSMNSRSGKIPDMEPGENTRRPRWWPALVVVLGGTGALGWIWWVDDAPNQLPGGASRWKGDQRGGACSMESARAAPLS